MTTWIGKLFGRRRPARDPEASAERSAAEDRLTAAEADTIEVTAVVERLRKLRRENHFGPMIARALRTK